MMGVELTINVPWLEAAFSMRKPMALPPPPPDMFSYEAEPTMPDLVSASPVPRAVPSQPPPAPPGMRKWILSTILSAAWTELIAPNTSAIAMMAASPKRPTR